jgi:hypothetical protein
MKEEVVIISGEPKNVYENGKDLTNGYTKWVYKQWDNPTAILREPQYAAIYVKGTQSIRVIIEIDKKSELEKGLINPVGSPIPVDIPIRFGDDKLEGIRYTTFRKLITHESTDDL